MTCYPMIPALHVCEPRGGEAVFALMEDMLLIDCHQAPKGFKTDGASVPRLARSMAGKFGHGLAEAIQHDYGYFRRIYSREYYDMQYRDCLMRDPNFPCWKARIYYRILRVTGWAAWRKNAKRPRSYFFEDLTQLGK